MLTRRTLLALSAATVALLAAGPLAHAQSAADATGFVVNLGNQMAAVVNGPGAPAQKMQQMQPLIERDVDVDDIARFCLGRFWRSASPQQQQQYLQLFHRMLINNIGGRLGDYQGVSFAPTTTTERDGNIWVGTVIRRPNQQPANVQWVVSYASGRPRVIDVVAEGTSLRITERSDFASYLARNGNDLNALLGALQRQAAG